MTDYDRSAVDTLTGYFYQFDQSILEILNLSSLEDSVAIECIEDIDVKQRLNYQQYSVNTTPNLNIIILL